MEDQDINCADCSNTFVFTASEQAFYSEKGFTAPKRCKPCRDIRKANGGGGNSGGGGRDRPQRDDRQDREMFDADCADCGKATQVPFRPKSGRPVYCRDCFKAHAPQR